MTTTARRRRVLAALTCAGALAATTACSSQAADEAGGATTTAAVSGAAADAATGPADPAGHGDCVAPDEELIELDSYDEAEPLIRLPLPAGWERSTALDSQTIRGTIGAPGLGDETGVPTVTVTVEELTGLVDDPAAGIDAELAGLTQVGAVVTDRSPTQVCGLPAERAAAVISDTGAELAFVITVYETADVMYAVVLTAQGPDPADPTYRQDVETVFEQLQVLPADAAA